MTTSTPLYSSTREAFEPADRIDIQVVGRLVEQQDVGAPEQGLSYENPEPHATVEDLEILLVVFLGNAQTDQQLLGFVLGVVTVLFGDDALKLAELHADLVGQVLAGGQQLLLLDVRRPQAVHCP